MSSSFPVLQGPVFLHGLSAACHLVLLLLLSILWSYKRFSRGGGGSSSSPIERQWETNSNSDFSLHRAVLFTCAGLSLFHLFFFVFNYYYLRSDDGDHDMLATLQQLDLCSRSVAWLTLSTYLHFEYSISGGQKLRLLLRTWLVLYLLLSCCFVILDIYCYVTLGILHTHLWLLDFGSILFAFFLNYYTAFLGMKRMRRTEGEEALLREHLLNGVDEPCQTSTPPSGVIKSPFSTSGLLSILTFSWMGTLLSVGYSKTLDLEDVPPLPEHESIHVIFPLFKNKLESYAVRSSNTRSSGTEPGSAGNNDSTRNGNVSTLGLVKALVFSTWKQILVTGLYSIVCTGAAYVGPYLIYFFVQYLNGSQRFANEGYVLVSAFVISKLLECFSQRHLYFRLQQVGISVRASLVAMIYHKGLTLSSNSRQASSSGEVINLVSVDAARIGVFVWYVNELMLIPIQVTLAVLILYRNLGLASLAALAATVIVMLANLPLGKLEKKYQKNMMDAKDARMKATSEILRNMRILKLQAWEMKFLSKMMALREKETNWLRKYICTSSMTTFFFCGTSIFVSVVTFGVCLLLGIPLESGKVLSALATFGGLQGTIYSLPYIISMVIQTKVSLDRISSFLHLEELRQDNVEKLPRAHSEVAVKISNGSFSWDLSSEIPTLKDVNFEITHGMKVAVCGMVGSGKTSFLSCILGEIPKISGTVKLCGTTAYVSQSPWILSGTIEDNILFGETIDRVKYKHVLQACSLQKDLEVLPFGDKTVIGERGINLSGGQKQRIQIARALYHDADIFLFDDPFSAVDAHTGTHLFKECLLGLLAYKTVIYVTHQVEFLPSADLILVMKNGRITQAGKYKEILDSGTDFMELVGAHNEALSYLDSMGHNAEIPNKFPEDTPRNMEGLGEPHKEEKIDGQNDEGGERNGQREQLVQDEEREKGGVGFSVYWNYITASYKGALVLFILLAEILLQILQIGSDYWIAGATPVSRDAMAPVSASVLLYVYVALAFGSAVCMLVMSLLVAITGYKTATLLFHKMHACIFRAPMSFFDSTPSGRIINRASTNQSEVDTSIPNQMAWFAFSVIELVGIVAVMSRVVWQVFIIFIPLLAASIWYQQYYLATARELARLVGVCEAPVVQHFAESISGLITIRSFNQESRFMKKNLHLNDAYSCLRFYSAGAMEWFCFRLDVFSLITFTLTLIFLIVVPRGTIDPAIAGLAVTYGLNLNMLQASVVLYLCNLENGIISVERILQYTCIPSEPPLTVDTNKPDPSWPSHGEIIIHDLQVRYTTHMPFVLRGLSCTFHGGMKTGIVGRTGSGKSTLIQTLFRIVDPTVGQILIDGIDISTIGLHDLRSRLSIIPQDPTMFEGTLRTNLDPLEEYTDGQIWEALDACQLGEEVRKKEENLDSAVAENGENWSIGQRQLVCLGRVILRRSKVLVLDEATASVDTATDSLIQKTLRQQFADCTVITIAHRITSVLDSDMVLLLDNGLIAETGSPTKLLEDKSSLFAKLVSEYTMRSSYS